MAAGVAPGTANIIATSGSIQGHAAVTVPMATLESIEVTPGPLTVPVGVAQQFQATGIYSNSTTVDMTSVVRWSSSNAAVVLPNSTGLASMKSQGSAVIIAASGNVQGQVPVIVSAPATPSFSPAAGTYTSAQKVTVGTATPSATIYYTTNGTTPTTGSAVYSGPITVSSTETVQAIAVVSGNSTSAIGSAAYTINLTQAAAPSFSVDLLPASVSITNGQSGTTTVLVTPQNGFASAVSFSCSGLPAGVSCSFSPASVIPSDGAASTTLTVTSAATIAALHRHHSPLFPSSMMAIAFCCLGWKRRRGLHLLLLAGVAIGLSLCTGCGSSEVIPISATTSTVSVIAASGSMQPTTSFTLEVR